MNVVRDVSQQSHERFEAVVITGDGKNETLRVKALATAFDHDRELFFPYENSQTGIRMVGSKQRTAGQAERKSLRALDIVEDHKGRGARTFFFIMDKEHIEGDVHEALSNKTDSLSRNDSRLAQMDDCAYKCEFDIGNVDITVYAVVIGDELECFEDRLAKLIRIKCGTEVNASSRDELKGRIDDILDDTSGATLIENSTRTELEMAFPSVCTVLSVFEDDSA